MRKRRTKIMRRIIPIVMENSKRSKCNRKFCVFLFSLLFICVIGSGCISFYKRKSTGIIKKHGKMELSQDTTIRIGRRQYVYEKGILYKTGCLMHGQKKGVWYFFSPGGQISSILKFRNDSTGRVIVVYEPTK